MPNENHDDKGRFASGSGSKETRDRLEETTLAAHAHTQVNAGSKGATMQEYQRAQKDNLSRNREDNKITLMNAGWEGGGHDKPDPKSGGGGFFSRLFGKKG
jgi:hypothetical protein